MDSNHPRYAQVVAQMFARQTRTGIKLGVERVRQVLDAVGAPDRTYRSVLVAGTNGKGSTCAFTASLLRQTGLKTGLYTSPHLCRFTERMTVNGQEATQLQVVELHDHVLARAQALGVDPTFFELATVMALLHFAQQGVDVAVLEVGLGGRLDATNAAVVQACGIAPVDLDHQAILGATRAEIAAEKAGIMRAGVPTVSAPQHPDVMPVLQETARRLGVPLRVLNAEDGVREALGLSGPHQPLNARLALELVAHLGVTPTEDQRRCGLAQVQWPGRMEWLPRADGLWLLDGAHNPHGVHALAGALNADERFTRAPRVVVVTAATGDRDAGVLVQGFIGHLGRVPDAWVAAQARVATAVPAERVAQMLMHRGIPVLSAHAAMQGALDAARGAAGADGLVVVMGSLYALGWARALLTGESMDEHALAG